MKYFPLFADLENADVLVAGGGEQAAQKVRLLRKTPARIKVVAEAVTEELRALGEQGAIRGRSRLEMSRAKAWSTPPRETALSTPWYRERPRRAASRSTWSMRPSCPPSSPPLLSIAHP